MSEPDHVARAQDQSHPEGNDYQKGSPHLRHPQLRSMVEARLTALVQCSLARTGACSALEVGGGHGTFTGTLLAAGAQVTVTETSRASADYLRAQYRGDPRVQVVYDSTGTEVLDADRQWDLVALISVLHHIPDYVGFITRLCDRIAPGGAFFSVQDPLYYPRRSPLSHRMSRGTYLAWRLAQGEYRRGIGTRLRRLRGVYDDVPSDLVEYHVVRQGVDEEAIRACLAGRFEVEIFTYWSTQSALFQRLFERTGLRSDFGVVARRLT